MKKFIGYLVVGFLIIGGISYTISGVQSSIPQRPLDVVPDAAVAQEKTTPTIQVAEPQTPTYKKVQLANVQSYGLVDVEATMEETPIKVTQDNGNPMYLMTVTDGGTSAVLILNRGLASFAGTKGDRIEVRGAVAAPVSFCDGYDHSLKEWCSNLDIKDGTIQIVPNYINNLNPQHPSTVSK